MWSLAAYTGTVISVQFPADLCSSSALEREMTVCSGNLIQTSIELQMPVSLRCKASVTAGHLALLHMPFMPATKPKDAAIAIVRDLEAYVLGVVDLDKERAKLDKQHDKLTAQIGGVERKLGNDNFLKKAPPEVVDQQRKTLADLRSQLESVERGLAAL